MATVSAGGLHQWSRIAPCFAVTIRANVLAANTIDRQLAKSDIQLGLEYVARLRPAVGAAATAT